MRWLGATVVCLAAVLSGCGALDKEPAPDLTTGCVDCATEVRDLEEVVAGLDEVTKVRGSRRTIRGDGYLSIGVDFAGKDVVSADVEALVDSVARAAWESGVNPLDVLAVDGTLLNGYHETNLFYFGDDRADYEARWGKRPAGTEWTPGAERPEQEGACADACRPEMREIARAVSALPGVTAVTESNFIADSPTNGWTVNVTVETDGSDVTETVAEIVWRSPVQPLEWIDVTTVGPGSDLGGSNFWVDPDDGKDHDRFVTMWGARP